MIDLRSLLEEHALAPRRDLDVDRLLSRARSRRVRRRLTAWLAALTAIAGVAVPVGQVLVPAGHAPSQSVHTVNRKPQPDHRYRSMTTSTTVSGASRASAASGALAPSGSRAGAGGGGASPSAGPTATTKPGPPPGGYTYVQVCSNGPSPFPGGGGPNAPPYCWHPDTVRVATGATVTWDGTQAFGGTVTYHTVTSTSANWNVDAPVYSNPNFGPGIFTYTFTRPGTYAFYCKLHDERGTVVVTGNG